MATYELSAFTEQELLDAGSGNGSNIGTGDSFTMPAETDAVISVWDNDGYLSGDSSRNERSNDYYGQNASITVDGAEVGNGGQIYAEMFFWVSDDAGNWYIMLEIEQENASGDYFVFYDYYGLPEAGAELTVACGQNITHCWEPRYDDMMQEPPFAPPIALNDMVEITEDQSIGDNTADAQLNILANDFDIDSDFALTGVTGGTVGEAFTVTTAGGVDVSVTIGADGALSFDTAGQFEDLDVGDCDTFVIEYTISDADGGTGSASVTVVIHGAKDGPIAVADHFTTTEGGSVSGNILDNDDANGNSVAVASLSADGETFAPGDSFEVTTEGGRTGTITVQADGSFTFETNGQFEDLDEGQTDSVALTYVVTGDATGENLIVNGDFENHGALTRGSGDNRWDVFESIEGWSTPTGQLEVQQGEHGGTAANAGDNSVIELDSHDSSDTNASISQTVSVGEDGPFQLSFDYSPRQLGDLIGETSGVSVIVNDEVVTTISSDTVGYENYSLVLNLEAGDNVIGFAGAGVDDTYGALLDNVELRGVATSEAEVSITITGEMDAAVIDAIDDAFATTESGAITANILANDDNDGAAISVTEISAGGQSHEPGDTFTVTTDGGRTGTVTVEADGSLTFTTDGNFDDLTTGETDTVTLSYTASTEGTAGEPGRTIDFSGLNSGDTVSNQIEGVTISGARKWGASSNDAMIFDSANPTGGDWDLATPSNGNILIISEDNDANDADDNSSGGSLTFTFDEAETVEQMTFIDVEEGCATITLTHSDGSVTTIAGPQTLNGEVGVFDVNVADVVAMTISLDGSGAVDDIVLGGTDGEAGSSDSATITLTITGENEGPVAGDDGFAVTEVANTFADITGNVLSNDSDADGDDLTVTAVNGDAAAVGQSIDVVSEVNGFAATVVIGADGEVTLSASDEFAALTTGEDDTVTLTYEISDGAGGTNTATVTLTVSGSNQGPVAGDDGFAVTEVANTFADITGNVLSNDSDADGDALTVTSVNGDAAAVGQSVDVVSDVNGFAATVVIGADGAVTLSASDEFAALTTGEDDTVTLIYEVSDGAGGTDTATVTLTVSGSNQGPVAGDDGFAVTEVANTFADITGNVLSNDSDADGDALTVTSVNGDAAAVGQSIDVVSDVNGFAATVVIGVDGEIALSASDEFAALTTGEDDTVTLTYEVSDGAGGTDTATVTLTVSGSNQGPVAGDDGFAVTEVANTFADIAGNVLSNDSDADGDDLTVTAVNGDAAAVGQSIDVVSDVNGFAATVVIGADGAVTLSASDEFAALADNQSDTVTVSYEVSDGAGGTDTATVTLTVNGVNEAPVAVDDSFETSEGPDGFETIVGNLLANDSDPDGDTISVTAIDGNPYQFGEEFELESDELGIVVTAVVAADGTISLTPGEGAAALGEGESDTLQFSYDITDAHGATSEANVTFVLNGANFAPDAQDRTYTSTEQEDGSAPAAHGNLLSDATDADGDSLSIVAVNGDTALVGGEFNLVSNENGYDVTVTVDANGDITMDPGTAFADLDEGEEETVSLTYEVSDGNGGTDTANVTLTVTGIEGNGGPGGPGGGGGTGQGNTSYNVAFIIDMSGSAIGTTFGGDENAFFENVPTDQQNLNGDAIIGSRADAELYTVQQISDQLASLNISDDIDVGFYTSALDTTSGFPYTGAQGITDGNGNVLFEAGTDHTALFNGATGNGPMIYNSGVSGANDWFTIATANDQYETTVNIVYVLSASNGIDFNPAGLADADADLAGELAQMDEAFDFTLDTIFFDDTVPGVSPVVDTLESYGDGVANVIDTGTDLTDVLNGVGDTVSDALNTVVNLVDDTLDTVTDLVDDLVT